MCRAYFFTDADEPGGLMGLVQCDRPCAAAKMIYVGPEHVTAVYEQLHAGLIPDDLPAPDRETLQVPADHGLALDGPTTALAGTMRTGRTLDETRQQKPALRADVQGHTLAEASEAASTSPSTR